MYRVRRIYRTPVGAAISRPKSFDFADVFYKSYRSTVPIILGRLIAAPTLVGTKVAINCDLIFFLYKNGKSLGGEVFAVVGFCLILLCFFSDGTQHIEAAEGYHGLFLRGLGDSGADSFFYGLADGDGLTENREGCCKVSGREGTGIVGGHGDETGDIGGHHGEHIHIILISHDTDQCGQTTTGEV